MKRPLFLSIGLVLLWWILSANQVYGVDIIQSELSARQHKLQSIEKAIKSKRKKKRQLEKIQQDVLAEIAALDKKIALQWESLQQAKADWTEAELKLEKTRAELDDAKRQAALLKKYIETRLNALRQVGEIGVLNVLLAADSVPDLLARQQYLKMILNEDHRKRKEYIKILGVLSIKEKELHQRQQLLKAMSSRLEKEAKLLEARKAEKEQYLEGLKKKGHRYRVMIAQLERARRKLKEIVEELTLKARSESRGLEPVTQASQFDFAAQKGRLNLPVPGKVILYRNRRKFPGMAIKCPWGTEIRAIFDGRVVYNDTLPGYGKVFIVDHGHGYMSLIAQGQSFKKPVGEEVAEGEVVGLSGGGPWVSEGVYVEIRYKTRQLNPVRWFDLRGIEIVRR